MQRIRLLTVGSLKTSWIRDGCSDFRKRIAAGMAMFDIEELPASKERRPERQVRDESKRLLKAFGGEDVLIVLDERGVDWTTQQYAEFLQERRDLGQSVTFVIGGAYGFDDHVREHADIILRLSALTLPHELCRVLFLEALYRSLDVIRGGGYHH